MLALLRPLYTVVDDMALQTPHARALTDKDHGYSYSELSKLSSYYAQVLRSNHDVYGKHVGLLYDRSAQSIILLLAIMKAGGIYVPLDRTMPSARLHALIESADIAAIVAPDSVTDIGKPLVVLPSKEHTKGTQTHGDTPHNTAYAIFTSGTTGLPKLALLGHRAVGRVMKGLTKRYHIVNDDKVLQFANLAFDASISEIFGAFYAGAELQVPDKETAESITKLTAYIAEQKITIAIMPPSLLAGMELEYGSVKTVVVAGEACPTVLARKMAKVVPHFINAYGPTECAICVSTYEVPKNFDDEIVPIGTALPGVNVLVLDDMQQVVANDVVGELYVTSETLFDGYYKNSERTDAVLVEVNGKKAYKTGDHVSMRDGVLVYISRTDDYVKLHGMRISPQEVAETIQRADPDVHSAAVVLACQNDEDKLVAFYAGKAPVSEKAVLSFARKNLPAYAVPSTLVYLDNMPLTANKKIDKNALRSMAETLQQRPTSNDVTNKHPQEYIKILWTQVLHASVGPTTDFFYAGGDSLQAMRMLAAVDKQIGTSLTMRELYEHSAFSAFVAYVASVDTGIEKETDETDDVTLTEYESMLWSASAHAGNPAAYMLTEVVTPDFPISKSKLEHALARLSIDYKALAYRYSSGNAGLEKRAVDAAIPLIENGMMTAADFDVWVHELANMPIDLTSDPLLSVHRVIVDGDTKLIIRAHHMVLSAGLLRIFSEALWRYYQGDDSNAANQSVLLQNYTDGDAAFWKTAYDSAVDYIQLPWSEVRPPRPQNNGHTIVRTLQDDVHRAVQAFTKAHGITSFVFYRSIFALALHRLSRQNDFYIGSSVDVRQSNALGNRAALLNTLPIRSRIEKGQTFIEYALAGQRTVREALEHRFMPLHEIVKLHPFEQDRLIGPFNVMFDYIEKATTYSVSGLGNVVSEQVYNDTSKYDVTLTVAEPKEEPAAPELIWEYDTDLLGKNTISQLSDIFIHLCTSCVTQPGVQADTVPLLDQKAATAMLDVGKGVVRLWSGKTYYERFSEIVASQPHAVAVKHAGRNTTYQSLQYLVDHYTAVLLEQDITIDSHVGVFMDRSVEMVATIVALWRLGYAYVPIEITFPTERISAILEATQMSLVMTKARFREQLPSSVRCVDDTYEPKNMKLPEIPPVPMDTLAYVIFTSGSTGKPKGVMIEHAGMMNHADGMIEYLHVTQDSTIAQTASHSFDISVWQLSTILLTGGAIAIYSKEEQGDLDTFTQQLENDNVTLLELVPSYIVALLEYLEQSQNQKRLSKVYALLSTGENISQRIIEGWFRHVPGCLLMNAYGPAEASDDTNLFTFTNPEATRGMRGLPVGTALPNVNVYVLDEALNPQPVGIQGEIYISGIAVGRGYINDRERTDKAFVTNTQTGERMYKTGDIGYWSLDRQLIYSGRSDFQVKLRGFRIELEEIEAHIASYLNVTAVGVIVSDRNNAKQLHAYFSAECEIAAEDVIDYLRKRLPEYMVPAVIAQLPTLPLNNSGKIDRKALAAQEQSVILRSEKSSAASEEEKLVMSIWREIFSLTQVRSDDDYYALGGDSITSFSIAAQLKAKGYSVQLQDILAYPKLQDFAKTLKHETSAKARAVTLDMRHMTFGLTPIQERLLCSESSDVMAQYTHVRGAWDSDELNRSIQAVIARHGAFYLEFVDHAQRFGSSPRSLTNYAFAEHEIDEGAAFTQLHQRLQQGDLFAYGVRQIDNRVSDLYMAANHLVIDIVSWHVLVSAIVDELTSPAATATIDYNFGAWVHALQEKTLTQAEVGHWQNVLKLGDSIHQKLSAQFTLDDIPEKQVAVADMLIPNAVLSDVDVYSAVISALSKVLDTESSGILIETHGRYSDVVGVDVSQTVGWFTTLFPVIQTTAVKSFIDIRRGVEQALAISDETKLAYGLALQRDMLPVSNEPLVVVNYLGMLEDNKQTFGHGPQALPIDTELLECNIYKLQGRLHVDLVLYASLKDSAFPGQLQSAIMQELKAVDSSVQNNVDEDRIQAILQRIGRTK